MAVSGRSSPAASRRSAAASSGVNRQVSGAQLGQLGAGAQPRQPQRRVGAAGHQQAQSRRQVINEECDRLVHPLGADQVVVIEEQQYFPVGRLSRYCVDQGRYHAVEGSRRGWPDERGGLVGDPWPHLVQRRRGVPPESRGVVVARVE